MHLIPAAPLDDARMVPQLLDYVQYVRLNSSHERGFAGDSGMIGELLRHHNTKLIGQVVDILVEGDSASPDSECVHPCRLG